MKLDVTQALLRPGEIYPFQQTVQISPQEIDSEQITFDGIEISGTYTAMDGAVHLSGQLSTVVHASCAMCMKPVDYPMTLEFHEEFRKDAVETEDEAFSYEGTSVSLEHMTLTLLMLSLPMRFLCQESCTGGEVLKPYNTIPNSSCQEDTQRPFEALKQLLEEDEEV